MDLDGALSRRRCPAQTASSSRPCRPDQIAVCLSKPFGPALPTGGSTQLHAARSAFIRLHRPQQHLPDSTPLLPLLPLIRRVANLLHRRSPWPCAWPGRGAPCIPNLAHLPAAPRRDARRLARIDRAADIGAPPGSSDLRRFLRPTPRAACAEGGPASLEGDRPPPALAPGLRRRVDVHGGAAILGNR